MKKIFIIIMISINCYSMQQSSNNIAPDHLFKGAEVGQKVLINNICALPQLCIEGILSHATKESQLGFFCTFVEQQDYLQNPFHTWMNLILKDHPNSIKLLLGKVMLSKVKADDVVTQKSVIHLIQNSFEPRNFFRDKSYVCKTDDVLSFVTKERNDFATFISPFYFMIFRNSFYSENPYNACLKYYPDQIKDIALNKFMILKFNLESNYDIEVDQKNDHITFKCGSFTGRAIKHHIKHKLGLMPPRTLFQLKVQKNRASFRKKLKTI